MNTNLILQVFGLFCGGIFILAFAGAGVFLLVKSFKDRKKAEASQGWPATQGQIIAARISESTSTDSDGDRSTSYSPAVEYTYNLVGQEYKGDKIAFEFTQGYDRYAKAQAALARYPLRAQVTVYYTTRPTPQMPSWSGRREGAPSAWCWGLSSLDLLHK